MTILKNTRIEEREGRDGRIRACNVTTWDVVEHGQLISEHVTKRDAVQSSEKNTHAVALGKLGGQAKSPAKTAAVRANAKRPRPNAKGKKKPRSQPQPTPEDR